MGVKTKIATTAVIGLVVVGGIWVALPDAPADVTASGDGQVMVGADVIDDKFQPPPFPMVSSEPVILLAPEDEIAVGADAKPAMLIRVTDERGVRMLELHITSTGGRPASGATVVVARGADVLGTGMTDETGLAVLDAQQGKVDLYIGGVSHEPYRLTLATASGTHRITLPAGATISGVVTVNGLPPRLRVPLSLESYPPRKTKIPYEIIMALRPIILGIGLSSRLGNAQVCGPGGTFFFCGLPDEWEGIIAFPRAYRIEGERDQFAVAASTANILLDLVSYPVVRGRVLEPGRIDAVPVAQVKFNLRYENGGFGSSLVCDEQGRFVIPIQGRVTRDLRLTITHPKGTAFREQMVSIVDHLRDLDLGDIELLPVWRVPFVVLDVNGEPISGAVAVTDDLSARKSEPTDDMGQSEISGIHTMTESVTVWAHRYRPETVAILAGDTELVTVVLSRAPSIDVVVRRADGLPPDGLIVRLEADEAVFGSTEAGHFGSPSFNSNPMATEVGMTGSANTVSRTDASSGTPRISGSIEYLVSTAGPVTLSGLLPMVPFQLSVRDKSGGILWGEETIVLMPEEFREVVAIVDSQPADVVVVVRDAAGEPVPWAWVGISRPGEFARNESPTDTEGRVVVKRVYAERIQLTVKKDGYASVLLADLRRPAAGFPVRVTLEAGLEVTVLIEDANGLPLEAEGVWAYLGDRKVSHGPNRPPGTQLDRTRWVLQDLPRHEVLLRARIEGLMHEQIHDPAEPLAHFIITNSKDG